MTAARQTTIAAALAEIDTLRADLNNCRRFRGVLQKEIQGLRRQVADRDGRIASLQSQLSWRAGR